MSIICQMIATVFLEANECLLLLNDDYMHTPIMMLKVTVQMIIQREFHSNLLELILNFHQANIHNVLMKFICIYLLRIESTFDLSSISNVLEECKNLLPTCRHSHQKYRI